MFYFNLLQLFYEIGAIEPLKKVASSPNATASKLAAQALKVIGESIPHKLTTQVPVWSVVDVAHWVAQVCNQVLSVSFYEVATAKINSLLNQKPQLFHT